MSQPDYFSRVSDSAEKKLEKAQDQITSMAERELRQILARLQKRFHRHRFRAAQSHGLLRIEISPPLENLTLPEHHRVTGWGRVDRFKRPRGAIKELIDEIYKIEMAWAKLEWRIGTYESDGYIEAVSKLTTI